MHSRLREDLKKATKSLHSWLEASEALHFLHNNAIDEHDYRNLILKKAVFFKYLESLIFQYADKFKEEGLLDIVERLQRSEWLKEDLTELQLEGIKAPEVVFKSVDNFSAAVGALYVCEGSVMGGMQILPMLKKRLSANYSYRYYSGYGDSNMQNWKSFTDWLSKVQVNREQAILGACEVFINLRIHLDTPLKEEIKSIQVT